MSVAEHRRLFAEWRIKRLELHSERQTLIETENEQLIKEYASMMPLPSNSSSMTSSDFNNLQQSGSENDIDETLQNETLENIIVNSDSVEELLPSAGDSDVKKTSPFLLTRKKKSNSNNTPGSKMTVADRLLKYGESLKLPPYSQKDSPDSKIPKSAPVVSTQQQVFKSFKQIKQENLSHDMHSQQEIPIKRTRALSVPASINKDKVLQNEYGMGTHKILEKPEFPDIIEEASGRVLKRRGRNIHGHSSDSTVGEIIYRKRVQTPEWDTQDDVSVDCENNTNEILTEEPLEAPSYAIDFKFTGKCNYLSHILLLYGFKI